jgi:hypothetical protein
MILKIAKATPRTTKAVGATLGEEHLAGIRKALADGRLADGSLVVLDLEGIEATNGSYLRATALWLLRCGQLTVRPDDLLTGTNDPKSPRPYDLYCALANVVGEVAQEVEDFFNARPIPILIARKLSADRIDSATLAGNLEPVLRKTLSLLSQSGAVSASDLHSRFKREGISVTAWNNRLADLCALRLIRRQRQGKQWIYEPITKEISYGRGIH